MTDSVQPSIATKQATNETSASVLSLADFRSALDKVRAGATVSIGTFDKIEPSELGYRTTQAIMRRGFLSEPNTITPRLGGQRYWPAPSGMARIAAQLYVEHTKEIARRENLAAA